MDEFQRKREKISDIISGIVILGLFFGMLGGIVLAYEFKVESTKKDYYFKYYNFDSSIGYAPYCEYGFRSPRISCQLDDGSWKNVLGFEMIKKEE